MLSEKYRPTCFEDVVGNKKTVDEIRESLTSRLGCRTIFITGPNGVGKTTLARIIGMHLRNKRNQEELDADISYNEIDCSMLGGIEEVRELAYRFHFKGPGGHPKVYIFDECSILSPSSQRVLLKSVEDKNLDFNYFIFVSSVPEKILPDLLDRLSERPLNHVTRTDIFINLKRICRLEKIEVDKKILIDISSNCRRKVRKSIQLLEDYISLPDDRKVSLIARLNTEKAQSVDKDSDCQPVLFGGIEVDGGNSKKKTSEEQAEMNSKTLHGNNCSNSVDLGVVQKSTLEAFESLENKHAKPTPYLDALQRTALTSTDILNTFFPEPRTFIAPFIQEGSLLMIYAATGVGKSWFALTLALALTRTKGVSFELGTFKIVEQCGVVMLDGELSCYDIQSRLSLLAEPFGEENPDTPLRIISTEELADDLDEPVNLDEEEWRNCIYLYMKNNPKIKVLIIDNLSSLCGGSSESSREAITQLNRWLLSVRRLRVAVIVIHHSNKAGEQRGHSGKIDNLHTVINLVGKKNADQLKFKIKYNKARFARPGDAKEFYVEAVQAPENPKCLTWNWYSDDTVDMAVPNKDDEIIAYLMLTKVTQEHVGIHFGVSQSKVSKCRQAALKSGYITEKGEITEIGQQFLEKQQVKNEDEAGFGLAA